MIAEEILKLKIGHEFKNEKAIATVKDVHQQTDNQNVPFMVKTEFSVTDVETGVSEKAVLHTYITKTFFMIQGKATMSDKTFSKDLLFKSIIKPFIEAIMKIKGEEFAFVNQFLKSKVKTLSTLKRKIHLKSNQCDICSRIFVNQQGVNIHKKKIHENKGHEKKK